MRTLAAISTSKGISLLPNVLWKLSRLRQIKLVYSKMNLSSPTYILGISGFYHDSAACLVRDGEIIAAAQEERFTRKKHDQSFPINAARYCLRQAGISVNQLAYVGFYD